jgi:GDP-4-dehydro-6-deoxy-D-mannose reductase
LFESLISLKLTPTFVNIGSSEEHGITENQKISEETPFNPASPYAVSKLAQDYLGFFYFKSYGIPVVRLRPFNHIGPRQDDSLATSSFAKQIAQIETGVQEPVIFVGNLEAKRDFTDVHDMVRAYFLAAQKCVVGEVYNIGSGQSFSLAKILEILLSFSKVKIKVKVDKNLLRPLEVPNLVCDPKKFVKATGWKPEITLEKTLEDILNYWRNNIHG